MASNRLQGRGFIDSHPFYSNWDLRPDPSLFIFNQGGQNVYILMYVDDILITDDFAIQVQGLLIKLAAKFSIKDLSPLHFFLGIEVVPHPKGVLLSQSLYITDLLACFGMTDYNPVCTPIAPTPSTSSSGDAPFDDPPRYKSITGPLQYATLTHPDVSFTVNRACQHMHDPTDDHWILVKRILRAGNSTDMRSSRKQNTVAYSSTESEYKALADASAKFIWL
ncbi:uncharacterized mitochondrial protein AtMg00810-like [Macadamia integrifolia]|uniref:uncharacterized mitochondrial protein AtMg00810-like n=1 Tax=Macadamia integrifolia TaxID=60698 RepID=UPI001C5014F7|nr:uncharacterized mitochondrial protein AtMg00810-like [Macadamia integrifolia]